MDPFYYLYGLIAIISISSIYGFSHPDYVQKLIFSESRIQNEKQYYRMITSSFLHANFMHLFFNMFVLFQFGTSIVNAQTITGGEVGGPIFLMTVYFASVLGGSILSYLLHLNQWNYTTLGASGGVTGVLMAFIVLDPDAELGLMFIPIPIKGYIFVFLYMCYEVYAMIKSNDNIGHDAHIGGAIAGILVTLTQVPQSYFTSDTMMKLGLVCLPLIFAVFYSIKKIKSEGN